MNARAVRHLVSEVTASDVVVVGSGVAGLAAALALAPRRVRLLTKTELASGGSSGWAQGGVAAALAADDSPRAHAEDTLAAAAGLADADAVAALTSEGPLRVRELIGLGARFDRDAAGNLLLGREGAHGRPRILHAGGDATGAEMVRALSAAVGRAAHVTVEERSFVEDLVLGDDGGVIGVVARRGPGGGGRAVFHRAAAVVLATGGYGQLYARTTNPPEVTGDGVAMAARAGAELADLELVQFHPTALDVDADPVPLVTEALRGEGALLVNDLGERFMLAVHPRAELAPRDVVARAIFRQQQDGRRVALDAAAALGDRFPERFPTVYACCLRHGIDPRRQTIPVTPAAHYAMGGVAVDAHGRASLAGLWACGETASTGVHGANRLASNSLLEALVFGARVAADAAGRTLPAGPAALRGTVWRETAWREAGRTRRDRGAARRRLRELMWRRVGLVRDAAGLEAALAELDELSREVSTRPSETGNLLLLGRLVAAAALARRESRGAHYRCDFPEPREEEARRRVWTYGAQAACPLTPAARPARQEIA
ncbi:MAG TPA: L-aspartate oxidase [Thermoanaerobaculia bacterium]|jgi:L-aspartate oxidase